MTNLFCRIKLHKWRVIPGTEEYTNKYYDEIAYFKCERCGSTSKTKWDVR